ncbi:PCNA-associated factor [Synchiropus splendidus]|uniref:PCNA-associated factor n=1 Tax=Synchiropus splendidus TaxID=270530 RepID=UPI00237DD347|nr:PCNA-associated factor [Synchiropus splendidus]
MVRTKADAGSGAASYRKAVAASAPRKSLGSNSSSSSRDSQATTPGKNKYAGGNPVCPRPTPTWQKGIGDFFGGPGRKPEKENQTPHEEDDDDEEAGGSGVATSSRKARPLPAEDEDDD